MDSFPGDAADMTSSSLAPTPSTAWTLPTVNVLLVEKWAEFLRLNFFSLSRLLETLSVWQQGLPVHIADLSFQNKSIVSIQNSQKGSWRNEIWLYKNILNVKMQGEEGWRVWQMLWSWICSPVTTTDNCDRKLQYVWVEKRCCCCWLYIFIDCAVHTPCIWIQLYMHHSHTGNVIRNFSQHWNEYYVLRVKCLCFYCEVFPVTWTFGVICWSNRLNQ